LRSTFSMAPSRTDTDRPAPSLTSAAASLAPRLFAMASVSSMICWNWPRLKAKPWEVVEPDMEGKAWERGGRQS